MGLSPETARENFSTIHSARNANTGSSTAVSFDIRPSTVPSTMPVAASDNPRLSREASLALSIIQRPCRYAHKPASTKTWHRLSMRCTTYNTPNRLIGSSIQAALTTNASRVAAAFSMRAFVPSPPGRGCPEGASEGSRVPVPSPLTSLPEGEGSSSWNNATNRNSARSMQNSSTPLSKWMITLVNLNGQGSPPPVIQFNAKVVDASGRCRKLAGEDNAALTHAATVELAAVMWIAALSKIFG